jgi:Flp pilus assembly protein TadB
MTPDQQAGSDHERQDDRADAERENDSDAERDEQRDEAEGREEGGGGEEEGSLRQDMKDLPGEMREDARRVYRGADENISQRMEEQPVFERALDLRIVAASLVIAFVLALILRLIGLPPLFAIVIFLIALGGLWVGLARFYASRRPRSRDVSKAEVRDGEDDGPDGGNDG